MTKVLYIATHPIQNSKPYRILNTISNVEYLVAYLFSPEDVDKTHEENLNHDVFDFDIMKEYNHKIVSKRFSFIQLVSQYDIIVVYGHNHFSFWIAMMAAKLFSKKIVLTTDITEIRANSRSQGIKLKFKPIILRWLYNYWANAVFVPSTASLNYLKDEIRVKQNKIVLTPYVVDEDFVQSKAKQVDRQVERNSLGILENDIVFVFCAKFIDRKRPADALLAFAEISKEYMKCKLIMIGDGPLIEKLKQLSEELGIGENVIFTGFIPYSFLPKYYVISDCLLFCSEHEPYGLPVNEAMLCGLPVIVSDCIGARLDLVDINKTGWIYKRANIESLVSSMRAFLQLTKEELQLISMNTIEKMHNWGSLRNTMSQLDFFKRQGWMI